MAKSLDRTAKFSTRFAAFGLMFMSYAAFSQEPGQVPMPGVGSEQFGGEPGQQGGFPAGFPAGAAALQPLVTFTTTLTFRSYQIAAGGSQGNLEGASCPAASKMISGACHPFYNARVTIINQFPNIPLNTWRCGFANNSGAMATVFIYTLCAQ
jgi:hypothetical protein